MAAVGQEMVFTDTSTNTPTSFEWDFGDGTPKVTTAQRGVGHTYANPGTFTITHKAANACGAQSCTKTAEVTVAPPKGVGAGALIGVGLLAAGIFGAVILSRK